MTSEKQCIQTGSLIYMKENKNNYKPHQQWQPLRTLSSLIRTVPFKHTSY